MKTARVSLCLAFLLSWSLASPALAQQVVPGQTSISSFPSNGDPEADDIHTRSIFDNRNVMLRSDAGDGVGYLRGYQTFAAFQPIIAVPDELVFWMSPRGYVTYNSGNFAGNLGSGVRWLNPGSQRILGGGAWWDHDNNGVNLYDQLGGSLEWLGNYFDLRANAYIPTNQNIHQISKGFNGNNVFIANNIGVGQTTITNSALRGGDFEAGGALPGIGDLGIRTYAGGYYYQGPASSGAIYGVRARAEALVTQDIWGTIAVSHDRVFGTNVTAAATVYLFTGNQQKFFGRIPMQTRLYQQQERQYRVAVQQDVENDTVLALRNGGTGGSGGPAGTPIFVEHVDNTAPAGGNGTVEHPFNFLPKTTPANVDVVFVHRGDGTSNMMNQGITLNNFERLLGQGVPHQFTDTLGTFSLPGFSAGPLPTITNSTPGGSAVTLASHNEVSGFNIANSSLHGITGTGIVDFNINNVNITGSGNSLGATPIGAGVQLNNATGTGIIAQSTFANNHAEGVRIDNTAGGTLNLTIDAVQSSGNLTGIELNATGSTINPIVTNTTVTGNIQDGFSISLAAAGATRSAMTGFFDHDSFSNNNPNAINPLPGQPVFGNGFAYSSSASDGLFIISRSRFDNNHLNGLSFTTASNSTLNATLVNNNSTAAFPAQISGNSLNGVLFSNTDSRLITTILNNTIGNNGTNNLINGVAQNTAGIDIISKGTGAFGTSATWTIGGYLTQDTNANGVLDAGENNVPIASLGPTIVGNGVLNAEGNVLVGNHGAAIGITLLDQGTGTGNIIGNRIQGTTALTNSSGTTTYIGQAIDLHVTGTTIASNSTAVFTGGIIDANVLGRNIDVPGSVPNLALGNAGGGIRVLADQNTSFQNLQIGTLARGNSIADNGNDGINITRANIAQMGNIIPVTIVNNKIENNAGNGASISALNSFDGIVNGFAISQNIIQGNHQNGVLLHVEADAQMDVDITNNLITQNALNGINTTELAQFSDLRGIGGTWSSNNITNNGNDGIWLQGESGTLLKNLLIGSLTSFAAGGNTIQNNGGKGIQMGSTGFTGGTPNVFAGFGAGQAEITYNLIDSNHLGGIYINSATSQPSSALVVSIDHNVITNNGTVPVLGQGAGVIGSSTVDGGDGIQIVDTGSGIHGSGLIDYTVSITSNTIRGNAGRGVNILNQTIGQAAVDIENNSIIGNKLEGIYVVNTASGTQSADVTGEVLLQNDGSTTVSRPRLNLTVNHNDIEGNGVNSLLTATGLVVRVGTSDGNFADPFFFDGGFYNDPLLGSLGGVGAIVTNNTFHGNLGDDVSFSAFQSASQGLIIGSTGTRSATQLTITNYGTDPLARLDLTFHNNIFDSSPQNGGNVVDSTDVGAITNNIVAAQYNNSDTFKSPLFSATLPGPYLSNTRFRNAERLAGRFLGILPPPPGSPPNYDFYLYPGMGQSTFRLVGSTTAADVAQAGFLVDSAPYVSPFTSANGLLRAGATPDEVPFGWTFLNGTPPPVRPQ